MCLNEKVIIFFIFNIYPHAFANLKGYNFKFRKIENFSFDFEQTINKKKKGNYIVDYLKNFFLSIIIKKKIMVSNGNLVIKNELSNQYYVYPLKKLT